MGKEYVINSLTGGVNAKWREKKVNVTIFFFKKTSHWSSKFLKTTNYHIYLYPSFRENGWKGVASVASNIFTRSWLKKFQYMFRWSRRLNQSKLLLQELHEECNFFLILLNSIFGMFSLCLFPKRYCGCLYRG